MVSFSHTAIGAAIGLTGYNTIGQANPVLGLAGTGAVAFAAHYLEDFIPHGHFFAENEYRKKIIYAVIFDLALSIILFSAKAFFDFGLGWPFLYILAGIFFSQLPDMFDGLIRIGVLKSEGLLKSENKLHELVHWHGTGAKTLIVGLRDIWQFALILAAFFFI